MSTRRSYPVSKPFLPPPDHVTAQPAAPVPPPLAAAPPPQLEKPRRRWGLFLFAGLLAGLATLGVIAIAVLKIPSHHAHHAESEQAFQRLQELQRQWWKNEAPGANVAAHPAVAFERLLDRQREWWDNENLAIDGNPDSSEPLDRLEQRERSWWEREGLDKGQAPSHANAALAQLEHLTRLWWQESRITRMPDPGAPEGGTANNKSGGDTPIKLIDKDNTRAFLRAGGTEDSERAVQLGLKWLASQQLPDGRWASGGKLPRARAQARYAKGLDTASTAFALLPFLAHGQTQRAVEGHTAYAKVVEDGLHFLRSQQQPDGDLSGGRTLYVHALAAIALCEAYDASSDPLLKEPSQKAIDFIVAAQSPRNGGWRYTPGMAGDLSVTSWCLMALKSGQMSGLHVPTKTLDQARGFLLRVARKDGGYNYLGSSPGHSPPTPAVMTAAGIVCRQYLQRDDDLRSAKMTRGVDIILANPPREELRNFYYYYYATYALVPIGGDAWKQWNPKVRDLLVSWQDQGQRNPEWKGSWDPQGSYALQAAGRVGVTSLALLTLEVYYRHLPLNRPELGEMSKPASASK